MYGVQNRIYCGVCHLSVSPENYPNRLRSRGHTKIVMETQCTNSMIIEHDIKKDK